MQQLDYEEDVQQLSRLWQQIKRPNQPNPKRADSKNESTQVKTNCDSKLHPSDKKLKVIVSDKNLKKNMRSPQHNQRQPDVIEVATRPQKILADAFKN